MTAPATARETGELSILSSVHGDLSITFSETDSAEVKEKAKATIERLLKQGFVIMTESKDKKHRRVTKFDPKKFVYIIREVGGDVELPVAETKATAIPQQAGG